MKVQPIYNSKILKKGLELAADNSLLFGAAASFALSVIARPAAIMAAPATDIENKKYACAKSLASGAVNLMLVFLLSTPADAAIKKIDKKPSKYLKPKTIKTLKAGEESLAKSGKYRFVSQLFKLGLGFLIAAPKSILTGNLIPPVMDKFFPKKNDKNISFTGMYNNGIEHLSKGIGKLIDTPFVQKMAEKFQQTRFEQHMISLTDVAATVAFIHHTAKNKKIEESRKKALMYNTGISTGLCIGAGYALSRLLDKPVQKFVKKFSEVNKNSPELDKYLNGVKVVKPTLIFGGIYYVAIPLISTFLADRFDNKNCGKK